METSQTVPPQQPISISSTDRQWAIGLHLSALLGFFTPHLLNIVGPLIVWLIKKPDSAYLDEVGKRVLNFQISYSLYGFICASLFAALWWTVVFGIIFGVAFCAIAILWLVYTILGAVRESHGEACQAPLVIKFFS